jgi:hypothetical protein
MATRLAPDVLNQQVHGNHSCPTPAESEWMATRLAIHLLNQQVHGNQACHASAESAGVLQPGLPSHLLSQQLYGNNCWPKPGEAANVGDELHGYVWRIPPKLMEAASASSTTAESMVVDGTAASIAKQLNFNTC